MPSFFLLRDLSTCHCSAVVFSLLRYSIGLRMNWLFSAVVALAMLALVVTAQTPAPSASDTSSVSPAPASTAVSSVPAPATPPAPSTVASAPVPAASSSSTVPATMRAPAPSFAPLGSGVSPILECWIGKNHRWVAVWSYSSDSAYTVPVGDPNNVVKLVTTAKLTDYPDQPTSFTAGYHRYVFSTSFPYFLKPIGGGLADEGSWTVNGKTVKTYLDERPYQCLNSKFKIHVSNPGAGTQAALKTAVAAQAGATVFEINFLKDPNFNYQLDFDTDPTITDPDVWPPETEPLDPVELLVKFSHAADLNANLMSTMVSSAGGTYVPMYTSQNSNLRTQSSGVEISSTLYPKDPTTPQGPVGNQYPPASAVTIIAHWGLTAFSVALTSIIAEFV